MNLSGNPIDFVFAFFAGILVSFTPCIYPLIPVSAGYIGATSAGSRLKGFTLSLAYATGVAVTYSILGLLASWGGIFFGKLSSHPVSLIIVGLIIIFFGLSMLEVFLFPAFRTIKMPMVKGKGHLPAFFLGLSSGLIVSPCLTPALGAMLAFLATKKDLVYGPVLLFCFAYGMSFCLILIGTFSAILTSLPKSGKWLEYIKKAYSFVLIGFGIYLIVLGIRRFL